MEVVVMIAKVPSTAREVLIFIVERFFPVVLFIALYNESNTQTRRIQILLKPHILLHESAFCSHSEDEDDYIYENDIFTILSSARARTNVILAGKRGSRRHSTMSFSENVVLAKTSYQILEV